MPSFAGIDPGLHGAVSFLHTEADGKRRVEVFDAPTLDVVSGKKRRLEPDIPAMVQILRQLDGLRVVAVMEAVNAFPGQGVVSCFRFGEGFGIWQGILSTLAVPYTLVHPVRWKKEMLADSPRNGKDAARLIASRLFPEYHKLFARVKDDGRAESLLMAEYARRRWVQPPPIEPGDMRQSAPSSQKRLTGASIPE